MADFEQRSLVRVFRNGAHMAGMIAVLGRRAPFLAAKPKYNWAVTNQLGSRYIARESTRDAMSAAATVVRSAAIEWANKAQDLDAHGWALLPQLITRDQCRQMSALYARDSGFRSRVDMSRHGFGRGEYRYFAYPLPDLVQSLRTSLYPSLAPIANAWHERMGLDVRFPPTLVEFIARCHDAGQGKPTPLLLQYSAGDYNCLHQDLYGEHVFPLQIAVLLSKPAEDFEGGEFVLTEQRPRMQSRVEVVPLTQGDGVVFAVNSRPVRGTRGDYRVHLRHGVSTMRKGRRHTLGIIFHDAK